MSFVTKRVAIVQSSYIPWKGYFDLINQVDEFILLDEVQYTRRDWRNRNQIKTPQGVQWLTIPLHTKGKFTAPILEMEVASNHWRREHWEQLQRHYSDSLFFSDYEPLLELLYLAHGDTQLSTINHRFLTAIASQLGITTPITWSHQYASSGTKTEKLVGLCRSAGATHYLSGPAARAYLEEELFAANGIAVEWMNYADYPEYEQSYPPFVHQVSILDLLFHKGPLAMQYLKPLTP